MKEKISFKRVSFVIILTILFVQLGFVALQSILFVIKYNAGGVLTERYHKINNISVLLSPVIIYIVCGLIIGISIASIQYITIRKLIDGMKRLAKGDYSIRIFHKHKVSLFDLESIEESFNIMAKELGNTELLRSDFINSFSHEFKTPISSIKGFARLLQNSDLTEQERESYTQIIYEESSRLSKLSENMLLMCNLENQDIISNESTYNFAEQIRQCILMLEPMWSKNNIEFDVDLEEVIWCKNEDFIKQMIINIIENAIKFSDNDETIDVRLFVKDEQAVFLVNDYGVGMSEQEREKMFIKFYQADTAHHTNGNGIGLSIVKRICELYDAEIDIQSKLDEGTQIKIIMPI